jgi:HEAT repeat protein/ATP/ADP translocase
VKSLGGLLGIRSGEGRLVALLAALFATVETGRGFGDVAADTLFLSRYGANYLPYLYVVVGLVSLVVALGYGAAIGRLRRRPFLVGLLATFAAILAAERVAVMSGASIVLPALWLSVFVVGSIVTTAVWTVAGGILDARQAKRLFPICTSAAIAGGFAGTLASGPLARLIGTENLIVLFALLLVAAAALTAEITGRFQRPVRQRRSAGSLTAELRVGFDYVRQSPLMRLVAIAYVLFSVLQFSVMFPFQRAMAAAFPAEADLATALGLLSAAVTGVSFLVSITMTNRLYARFGIVTVALLLPLVYLAGFGVWLLGFGLVTAVAVRFVQQVTQRGVSNAAWSAIYNVVPAERRPQVLAFMDGVPGQLGISLSGVLLLVVGALLAQTQIFVMGAIAAGVCTWVVLRIRRNYGKALISTLRAGLGEQVLEGGPGLSALARDPNVLGELRTALTAPQPGARRLASELLGRLGGSEAADALVGAVADPDPEVRVAALLALAVDGQARPENADAIARALADAEPAVRAAAVRALAASDAALFDRVRDRLAADSSPAVRAEVAGALAAGGDVEGARIIIERLLVAGNAGERLAGLAALGAIPSVEGGATSRLVAGLLADEAAEVRAAAIRVVGKMAGPDQGSRAQLVAALDDEAPVVRRAAAQALRRVRDTSDAILDVLERGSDRSQAAALLALDADVDGVRSHVRDWAIRQVDRAILLRRDGAARGASDATALGGSLVGTCETFLRSVLGRREHQIEDRLLVAIGLLGAPEANGPIRRSLRSKDAETRAQAIEALDALGDRHLGRVVVRWLDADGQGRQEPAAEVLRSLADDPDPWIRTFAIYSLSERLAEARRSLRKRILDDPDPIVRSALADIDQDGGDEMPETDRTLGEIERMLFLRRVPIFGQLAPEDLQRIAAAATERLYPGDEALVREGELGDELIVIVEGGVRVVHGDGDDERLIRTYEAGDHIGELAVLTDRPRAATVIAGSGGVRGLVIGGEGLRAILRERPDAAMAMLATLAQRISVQ